MKILVIGTWDEKKSSRYSTQAEALGKLLAKRGHELVASPSSGIQGMVAKSYKANGGINFIGFCPDLSLMKKVGEVVMVEPDEKIMTYADYPIRNIMQVKASDAVIAVTGGRGTITELIASANDYDIPTSYLYGSSLMIDGFLKIDKDLSKKVGKQKDILSLVEHVENNYISSK